MDITQHDCKVANGGSFAMGLDAERRRILDQNASPGDAG